MEPITTKRTRARANHDLTLVLGMLDELEQERNEANAAFDLSAAALNRKAVDIRTAMREWDEKIKPAQPVSGTGE